MSDYVLTDPAVARKQLRIALAAHQPLCHVVAAASGLFPANDPKLGAEGYLGLAYAECWADTGPVKALEYVAAAIELASYNDLTVLVLATCLQADLLRSVRNFKDARLALRLARSYAAGHPWLGGMPELVEGRLLLMTNRNAGAQAVFRTAADWLADGPPEFYALALCHLAFAQVVQLCHRAAADTLSQLTALVKSQSIQHSQIVSCRELLTDTLGGDNAGHAIEFYELMRI